MISDGNVAMEQAADSHQCQSRACRVGETHIAGLGAVTVVRWHGEQARIKNDIINWILFYFIQVLVLTGGMLLAHGCVPDP